MAEKQFSKKAALEFGWNTLQANVGFLIGLFIAVLLLIGIPGVIAKKIATAAGPVLGLPLNLLNFVWQSVISIGVIKISLRLIKNEKPGFGELFSGLPLVVSYVVAKFLLILMVVGGLILLVVPGIIFAIMFYMSTYIVVDKDAGPIEALKRSAAITKGVRWELFIFSLILLALNLVGAICLGVGLLVSLPISTLASVYVYRQLDAQTT